VRDLTVSYRVDTKKIVAVNRIGLDVRSGESLGVVGESGSGKSTLGLALMQLLPPNGSIGTGVIELRGTNLLELGREQLRMTRGKDIAMIFQDPLTSLNPTLTIGTQMADVLRAHGIRKRRARTDRTIRMLEEVGIPDARDRLKSFPHQFSGGMRQRIMIAMALMLEPALVIADEPTSALDTTLQKQILHLMKRLRTEHGTAMLFISHDLGVVAEVCDRVIVMYAGKAVEEGEVSSVLKQPLHPYTQALLESRPSGKRRGERLAAIPGRVPSLANLGEGCAFADRCPHAQNVCRLHAPLYVEVGQTRVRCHIYDENSDYEQDHDLPASTRSAR
jgi:peptide/nickel transport system ATP-binding protein